MDNCPAILLKTKLVETVHSSSILKVMTKMEKKNHALCNLLFDVISSMEPLSSGWSSILVFQGLFFIRLDIVSLPSFCMKQKRTSSKTFQVVQNRQRGCLFWKGCKVIRIDMRSFNCVLLFT